MIIEELVKFDKYNLSLYKMIYQYYKPSWLVIGLISFLIGFASFAFLIFNLTSLRWFGLFLSIPSLVFLFFYNRKKTLFVLKTRYEKAYNLQLTKGWSDSDIWAVRLGMFSNYIKDAGLEDKDKLRIVIEYLNDDHGSTKYNYKLTETFAVVLMGAWLGALISVSLSATKKFMETNRLFISIGFVLIVAVVYLEKFVIKEIVLWRRNRNKRLKQIIYSYLVEK